MNTLEAVLLLAASAILVYPAAVFFGFFRRDKGRRRRWVWFAASLFMLAVMLGQAPFAIAQLSGSVGSLPGDAASLVLSLIALMVAIVAYTANSMVNALVEEHRRAIQKEWDVQKAKDNFIFLATHELKAPVTAIRWGLECLKEDGLRENMVSAEDKEVLSIVESGSSRLNELVNDLLDVSRLEYGSLSAAPCRLRLAEAVEQAMADVRGLSEARHVDVVIEGGAAGLPEVWADPKHVRMALVNLLSNAVKYNSEGGRVSIAVESSGGKARVSVRDTGIGLDKEDIAKLFKKFSRVENEEAKEVQSTGLGLYIVKQIVEQMGGEIWVESEGRGKGSTFLFTLPVAK